MKKYMAIKESYWKKYHYLWSIVDSRYGMEPYIAYEVNDHIGDAVILKNPRFGSGSYFSKENVCEVTPEENPEYFI
jgi:hypothetical protein